MQLCSCWVHACTAFQRGVAAAAPHRQTAETPKPSQTQSIGKQFKCNRGKMQQVSERKRRNSAPGCKELQTGPVHFVAVSDQAGVGSRNAGISRSKATSEPLSI